MSMFSNMAASLSDDEFVRMQSQLLELREQNYQLSEKCMRVEREYLGTKTQYENLDKEYQKAVKTISKSKKAKEVNQLMEEMDSLQRKMMSQEEDFRLQNETIMQELGQLIAMNENLEKENVSLKEGGTTVNQESNLHKQEDELRRLQAQNSALQKNLLSCQEKYETELSGLRQTVSDLEAQCVKLSGQRGTPVGEGSLESRTIEGQSDPEPSQDIPDAGNSQNDESCGEVNQASQEEAPVAETPVHTTRGISSQLEDLNKEVNDLRLSLDTEKEEKKILKEQLQASEKSYKEQIKSVQDDLEKLTEKYKKKQESLVQLQEEKEKIYNELSLKLEEVQSEKNTEIQSLQEQTGKVQSELSHCNEVMKDYETKSNSRIFELEHLVQSLETKVDASSFENNIQLSEQNIQFSEQLKQLETQLEVSRKKITDLQAQLQGAQNVQSSTLEQMNALQQDRDQQIQALQESNRVAEKRKSLLDELAIKYQEESDQHREQIKSLEEKHSKEVDILSTELEELQIKVSELDDTKEELELIKSQANSLENTKGWLERRLNETEELLNKTREEHSSMLETSVLEHEGAIQDIKTEHDKEIEKINEQITKLNQDKEELGNSITEFKQKIKDGVDEKKIHEKKGLTMLRDLKKQLHAERKRGEKLQERLQELLAADNKSRQSVEDLFRPTDPNDRYRGDNSSVGSWSASGISKETSGMTGSSPDEETTSGVLEHENEDLLKRLSAAQQEKWNLEEKVNHLESSNAAMADDLLKKTAIIEHYVMSGGKEHFAQSPTQDKITLKRVVDFVKDKGDENLRDMNRKLQRMLEETLTKNMHLQQDLETLSQEVVRLSKHSAEPSAVPTSH